jgi:8-oxo-dGTP pyrophosphatase MutT (NUDIX family)
LDKVLFQNEFLAVIDRDGYVFSREVRCDGVIVSILPFRQQDEALEFLARLEVCPAHGPELERCSITGGLQEGKTVAETAVQELLEESGYRATVAEMIGLGKVRPSKSSDTTVYLFAVDVSGKTPELPEGDGTPLEATASVEWVSREQGIQIEDPLFVTMLSRL